MGGRLFGSVTAVFHVGAVIPGAGQEHADRIRVEVLGPAATVRTSRRSAVDRHDC
jgi:hypothetical protein